MQSPAMETHRLAAGAAELELRCFGSDHTGAVLLLVHGALEDGRIFHPREDQGLAGALAHAGHCAYVADLRGHGQSSPALLQAPEHMTQSLLIREDLPAMLAFVQERHPTQPVFCVGHGWGGVWLASALARQPALLERVRGLVHFGVRRRQRHGSRLTRTTSALFWQRLLPLLGRLQGVVPARAMAIGSADEGPAVHAANLAWMRGEWRDLEDGFDYASAIDQLAWPPSLYVAGEADRQHGHIGDVRDFVRELGPHDAQILLLEKGQGCSRRYGHNDLLRHPQAEVDHFPLVLAWLEQHLR
ncbi:MAG: alpha/beta fold hydrolase [Halopseudomonas sp.]|uniref:alpha/beta fold hydrolase n=1 Tax=Halopseudomonas sp. TaxID=2901191 RepID=UPI0030035AA5